MVREGHGPAERLDGDDLDSVAEGTIVGDAYRVEGQLGAGGMGVVVAARHVETGQRVALKIMRARRATNPLLVRRFRREARAASSLSNPHVARVLDFGQLADGRRFMALELLTGESLHRRLKRQGPADIECAVDWLLQACEGLAEAHARGIVHRDLKPSNLFSVRTGDGRSVIKVLDFGVATAPDDDEGSTATGSLTPTNAVLGSLLYMSPEQLRSPKHVDARSDIWSLGVILHQLLTGALPFQATDLPSRLTEVVAGRPERLTDRLPQAPPQLEDAILRCLRKDPTQRFQNVAELARALGPHGGADAAARVRRIGLTLRRAAAPAAPDFVEDEPTMDDTLAACHVGEAPDEADNPTTLHWQPSRSERATPRRKTWLLAATIGLAAAVVIGWTTLRSADDASTAAAASSPSPTARPSPVSATGSHFASQPRAAATVSIRLQLNPADAEVWLAGMRRVDNPVELPRGERPLELVIEAAGYERATRELVPDRDKTLVVALEPTRRAAPRGPPRPPRAGPHPTTTVRLKGPMEPTL